MRHVRFALIVSSLLLAAPTGSAFAAWGKDRAKDKAKDQPASAAQGAAAVPTAAPEEIKAAHTFKDDAELAGFSKLWQQRQGILLRLSVLQAYVGEEQAALRELDKDITGKYGLDFNKNYTFDRERKALIEVPEPTPPAPSGSPASPAPASP